MCSLPRSSARTVPPEEFRPTLKTLLGLHYTSTAAFDQSWTVRYASGDYRDLMVEVTQLLPSDTDAVPSPSVDDGFTPPKDGFEPMLKALLANAQDSDISFDRSWRFQYADPDCLDLLVEVTYLEKLAANP